MSELQTLLNFIQKIEAENSGKSAYEIANILRGYTKKSYTSKLWTAATGYEQKYIDGTLNEDIILSGVETDFGHLIGALSDQINEPGFRWSDLTRWTADHTSWAGDIGSAIAAYRSPNNQLSSLDESLNRFARDSDQTANIAAYLIGEIINSYQQASISRAILQYHRRSYSNNIKLFIQKRFRGVFAGNILKNSAKVDGKIRRGICTFLKFSLASEALKSVKNLDKLQSRLDAEDKTLLNSYDILQGSLHFLNHLVEFGELKALQFQPYRRPRLPWFGTVDYPVRVPKN